jgi:hypothetical protein
MERIDVSDHDTQFQFANDGIGFDAILHLTMAINSVHLEGYRLCSYLRFSQLFALGDTSTERCCGQFPNLLFYFFLVHFYHLI